MRRLILVPVDLSDDERHFGKEVEEICDATLRSIGKGSALHASLLTHDSEECMKRCDYFEKLIGKKGVIFPFDTVRNLVNNILLMDLTNPRIDFIAFLPSPLLMEFGKFWNQALKEEFPLDIRLDPPPRIPIYSIESKEVGILLDSRTQRICLLGENSATVS